MDIIILLLACFGLTNILVNGSILNKFRDYISKWEFIKQLINCSMCTGFWVGLYFSLIITLVSIGTPLFYIITLPFASSGISWILERSATIIDYFAYKIDNS